MNVVVAVESRFDRTPDGSIWTQGVFSHRFWTRYLDVFEQVRIVARVRDVTSIPPGGQRADGEAVSFLAVPYYVGPWQYVRQYLQVRKVTHSAVCPTDAVILRVGSQIAATIEPLLRRAGHPYAVEVIGDPWNVFAPGAVRHPLRPFFRRWFTRQLKLQCSRASAAAYVTENALQSRYPPSRTAYTTHYSSIELPEAAMLSHSRTISPCYQPVSIVTIGSLEQPYKGFDVLIDAMSACIRDGLDLHLTIVGNGKYRSDLEAQATKLRLTEKVRFLGKLPPGDAIRTQLDQADLFVLPSRTEGLPRAMIEAMARALPCIGTSVGGIPELLPSDDLVAPGNAAALAAKIREVLLNPSRMESMSAQNLAKATEYRADVLRMRRIEFFRHLRDQTEAYVKATLGS